MRIDFGRGGEDFYHTWWPRGPEGLNTQEFWDELGRVVNDLRKGVLKDLSSMRRYCYGSEGAIEGGICCLEQFQSITNKIAALKEQRKQLEIQRQNDKASAQRINTAVSLLDSISPVLTEWDGPTVRQMVDTVRVLSAEMITVYLRGGIEIRQELNI